MTAYGADVRSCLDLGAEAAIACPCRVGLGTLTGQVTTSLFCGFDIGRNRDVLLEPVGRASDAEAANRVEAIESVQMCQLGPSRVTRAS